MDKFLGGSGSVPLQAAFVEAAKFIESVGVAEIEARNVSLAARFKAQLAEISSVNVLSPMGDAQSAGWSRSPWPGSLQTPWWPACGRSTASWCAKSTTPRSSAPPSTSFNTEDEVDTLARGRANCKLGWRTKPKSGLTTGPRQGTSSEQDGGPVIGSFRPP